MSEVTEIENFRKDQAVLADRHRRLTRLLMNPDFKKLIMEDFCVNEAARYVQASGDPALNDRERADALAIAQASGHLKRYIAVNLAMGANAQQHVEDADAALEEARREEAEAAAQPVSDNGDE